MRRVVVTGIGLVTPLGLTTAESWDQCVRGESGIDTITKMDVQAYPTKIAGEVKNFDAGKIVPNSKELRRFDVAIQYSMVAAMEAVAGSGLTIDASNAERVGVVIGSGIGGARMIYDTSLVIAGEGPRRVSPFFVPASIINTCSGYAAIYFGAKGPNYSVVSACATGNHALADGLHVIRRNEADVMIVGGTEAAINPLGLAGFCAARALSKRNGEPGKASRPFDRDRDGFVLGEGAGVFVLEELEHARRRGAPMHAELVSCGMSADAFHITAPAEKGEGAARAMSLALQWGGLKPEQVDYINAHGTSTELGDIAEIDAVKSVFGSHTKSVGISSTKSMTGHLLGAASAVEAGFTILALRDGVLPPTINLENVDPRCEANHIANASRRQPISVALSNGFGFGGTNTSLLLAWVDR